MEIQKYKDEVMKVRENSLLQLSSNESENIRDFRIKHFESCGNTGDYEYRLIGTGIGTDITIKCPICHGGWECNRWW